MQVPLNFIFIFNPILLSVFYLYLTSLNMHINEEEEEYSPL